MDFAAAVDTGIVLRMLERSSRVVSVVKYLLATPGRMERRRCLYRDVAHVH